MFDVFMSYFVTAYIYVGVILMACFVWGQAIGAVCELFRKPKHRKCRHWKAGEL